jgi:hypothetical protein
MCPPYPGGSYCAKLISRQFVFETLDARQIASLLWQIFIDAHRFFSTGINV